MTLLQENTLMQSPFGEATKAPFSVSFETITPVMASELLANNRADNRHINPKRVAALAEELLSGYWATTHQGIALDENGKLMDGQHRLSAVVLANCPATMMVCRGVESDQFPMVDAGSPRRAAQFLTGTHASLRAAMARTLMQLEKSEGIAEISSIASGKFSTRAILSWLDDHPDVKEYGEAYSRTANQSGRKFQGTTPSAMLAAGFLVGKDKWLTWWEEVDAVASGEGLEFGNPLRALFNVAPLGGGAGATRIQIMRAFRVAKDWREGKEIKLLKEPMYKSVKLWG